MSSGIRYTSFSFMHGWLIALSCMQIDLQNGGVIILAVSLHTLSCNRLLHQQTCSLTPINCLRSPTHMFSGSFWNGFLFALPFFLYSADDTGFERRPKSFLQSILFKRLPMKRNMFCSRLLRTFVCSRPVHPLATLLILSWRNQCTLTKNYLWQVDAEQLWIWGWMRTDYVWEICCVWV